jgi:hypothetical protein
VAVAAVLALATGFALTSPVATDMPQAADAAEVAQAGDQDASSSRGDNRSEPVAAAQLVSGPSLKAEAIVHDWGSVELGSPIQHKFLVRNEGDAPARLVRSRTLRRNLDVKYDSEIPAGGIGSVEVTLPTDVMSEGRAQVALQFDTNASKPLTLLLTGELVSGH